MAQYPTDRWRVRSRRLVLVLFAGSLVTGGTWLWRQLVSPVVLPRQGLSVRIAPGSSLRNVALQLAERGVVRHAWLLTALARWQGVDRQIHAGDYRFTGSLSVGEVLNQLRSTMATLRLVTIPEGLSKNEVIGILSAAGLGGEDVFECVGRNPEWLLDLDLPSTGLEGYLFPDTYSFSRSTPPRRLLSAMVERYRQQVARLSRDRVGVGLSEHQMVTLASIIEKETGTDAERPLISAVFHNRLRLGMPLQSDPTAVYERRDFRGPITRADLENPSAYNTYRHAGLPPGPICNPGLASLTAAVRPAPVNYLFFVSRNDGTHEFSSTLADHMRAVSRYRRQHNNT